MGIYSILSFLVTIIFFKGSPEPLTATDHQVDLENNETSEEAVNQTEDPETDKQNVISGIKTVISRLFQEFLYCLKDTTCRSIIIIFSLTKGSFIAVNSVMVTALSNLNYTKLVGSIVITASLFSGLAVSMIYTRTIGKRKSQKFSLSILICLSLFFISLSIIALYSDNIVLFMLCFIFSGMMLYSFIPMMLEIATRLTLPFSKSSLNAFLMLLAQLFAVVVQIISGFMFKSSQGTYGVLVMVAAIYVLNFIVLRSSLKN